jgi:hypothetical protein
MDNEEMPLLSEDDLVGEYCRIAQHSDEPEFLRHLARSPHASIRKRAAGNPRTPSDDLEWLAGDPEMRRQWRLICNPSLPERCLLALAHDADFDVRLTAWTQIKRRRRKLPPGERERLPWPPPDNVRHLM